MVAIEALAQQPEFPSYDLVRVNVREEWQRQLCGVKRQSAGGRGYPIFGGTFENGLSNHRS